jgi:hypothetical protein
VLQRRVGMPSPALRQVPKHLSGCRYPKAWVARPNSLRNGIYIGDYNTADKLTVEVLKPPATGAEDEDELRRLAILSTVVPGFQSGQQSDRLQVPSKRLVKSLPSKTYDGQKYLYLTFPSETTTRSGYDVVRKNWAVAALKKGSLYVCAVSATSDQLSKGKEELLR